MSRQVTLWCESDGVKPGDLLRTRAGSTLFYVDAVRAVRRRNPSSPPRWSLTVTKESSRDAATLDAICANAQADGHRVRWWDWAKREKGATHG